MYSTFEVSHFRGIGHASLKDMARVNIITGLNDAGKTSVLEALFLHASGPLAGASAIQTVNPSRGIPIDLGGGFRNPWEDFFFRLDETVPVVLSGRTDTGSYELKLIGDGDSSDSGQLAFAVDPSGGPRVENSGSSTRGLGIVERRSGSTERRYQQTLEATLLPSTGPGQPPSFNVSLKVEPAVSTPFRVASYVSSQVSTDIANGYSALRRQRVGSVDLVASLRELDDRIQALEVLVNNGRPELFVTVDGVLLPFQVLGDGPRVMAQYLVSLVSSRNGLLLIDEFGSGIHHSLYSRVWKVLHRAAERLNVQIVATTHSAECLDGAFMSLANRPRELAVYRLRRSGESTEMDVRRYSDSKLRAAVEMNAELR